MPAVLSVSSLLLVFILGARYYELRRGKGRFFELFRTRLDRLTFKILENCKHRTKKLVEFVHKDIVLYVIHLLMSIALLSVRYVEKWLERITLFIRSFRKKRVFKATSENLRVITRERRKKDNNEQNL